MATAQSELQDWFTYLKQFQTCCCQANTDACGMNLLQFCNAKIADLLSAPPDPHQGQFSVSASAATGLPVTPGAVSGAATFLALLQSTWAFPDLYVAAYIQSFAPASFSTMQLGDFVLQKLSAVFPGGATDPNWSKVDAGLASIMGQDLYSSTQRPKVAAIVADATKLISDAVNQIVTFG